MSDRPMLQIQAAALQLEHRRIVEQISQELIARGWYYDQTGSALLRFAQNPDGTWGATTLRSDTLGQDLDAADIIRGADPRPTAAKAITRSLDRPLAMMLPDMMPRCIAPYRLPCLVPNEQGTALADGYQGQNAGGWLLVGRNRPAGNPDPACPTLRRWLSDVRFTHPTHLGNLITWLAAAMARPAATDFPHLIIGGRKSSGKSRIGRGIGWVLSGMRPLDPGRYNQNDHELEIAIAKTILPEGPNVLYYDNVSGTNRRPALIGGNTLCRAATVPTFTVRKLHEGPVPVYAPIFIFSMNDAKVSSDLSDRIVYIEPTYRGSAQHENYYFKPDPEGFAQHHWAAIQDELRGLCRGASLLQTDDRANFRFPLLNRLAPVVSARLQIPVALGREGSDDTSVDSALLELYNLVDDDEHREADGGKVLIRLADLVNRRRDFCPELFSVIQNSSGSGKAWAAALQRWIADNAHRTIRVRGEAFRFVLYQHASQRLAVRIDPIQKETK